MQSSVSKQGPQQRNITEINEDDGFTVKDTIAIQSVKKPSGSEIQYKSGGSSWTTLGAVTMANSPVVPAKSSIRFVYFVYLSDYSRFH